MTKKRKTKRVTREALIRQRIDNHAYELPQGVHFAISDIEFLLLQNVRLQGRIEQLEKSAAFGGNS